MKPILQAHPEWIDTDVIIIKHLREDNSDIVYGGKAIKSQLGYRARDTYDYDIFSKHPLKCAQELQRAFNKISKTNSYLVRPAKHPGTYKVYIRKGHKNINLLDFTKEPKNIKYVTINGIKYRILSSELHAKEMSLKDKKRIFRIEKDSQDYRNIKSYLNTTSMTRHLF